MAALILSPFEPGQSGEERVGEVIPAAVTVHVQGERLAISSVRWRVVRADGSPLWRFTNTYNLVDGVSGWKIAVSTTHADAA